MTKGRTMEKNAASDLLQITTILDSIINITNALEFDHKIFGCKNNVYMTMVSAFGLHYVNIKQDSLCAALSIVENTQVFSKLPT